MKIEMLAVELKQHMLHVKRSGENSLNDAYKCVKIVANSDGCVSFETTNGSIAVKSSGTAIEVLEPGEIMIDTFLFSEIVSKSSGEKIVIETDNKFKTNIRSEDSSFKIKGLSTDSFPNLVENTDFIFSVNAEEFKKAVQSVSYAVAVNNLSNPVLEGIKIKLNASEETLEIVAVDGYRLALRYLDLTEKNINSEDVEFIIPGKSLNDFLHLIKGEDVDIEIYLSKTKNTVLFNYKNVQYYASLLAGEFMNIKKIIPKDYKKLIKANTADLKKAVDRACIFSDKDHCMKMGIKEGSLYLNCQSQVGNCVDKINIADTTKGEDLLIGVNPQFMKDVLNSWEAEDIYLGFNTETSPISILHEKEFRSLILPVRIRDK